MPWDPRAWNLGGWLVVAVGCGGVHTATGSDTTTSGSTTSDTSTTTSGSSGSTPECGSDDDCGSDQQCEDGTCVPVDGCGATASCSSDDDQGDTQQDSSDGDSGGYECDDDSGCSEDEHCYQHYCLGGEELGDCATGQLEVVTLSIPVGTYNESLALVARSDGYDQLVISDATSVGVVVDDTVNSVDTVSGVNLAARPLLVGDFDLAVGKDVALTGMNDTSYLVQTFSIADGLATELAITTLADLPSGVGDFDGDGWTDLVLAMSPLTIRPGRGDGTFDPAIEIPTGVSFQAFDFDGDAIDDLVEVSHEIWRGGPLFAFELVGSVPWNGPPLPAHHFAADFDDDGTPELGSGLWSNPAYLELSESRGSVFATYRVPDARGIMGIGRVIGDTPDIVLHGAVVTAAGTADACVLRYATNSYSATTRIGNVSGDDRDEIAFIEDEAIHVVTVSP